MTPDEKNDGKIRASGRKKFLVLLFFMLAAGYFAFFKPEDRAGEVRAAALGIARVVGEGAFEPSRIGEIIGDPVKPEMLPKLYGPYLRTAGYTYRPPGSNMIYNFEVDGGLLASAGAYDFFMRKWTEPKAAGIERKYIETLTDLFGLPPHTSGEGVSAWALKRRDGTSCDLTLRVKGSDVNRPLENKLNYILYSARPEEVYVSLNVRLYDPAEIPGRVVIPPDVPEEEAFALFAAIDANDASGIAAALRGGLAADRDYKNRGIPLHHAVIKMHPGAVRALLDAGAGVDFKNHMGTTPLMLSIMADGMKLIHTPDKEATAEILELLLDRGADVNAVGDFGDTPLTYAVGGTDFGRAYEIARVLLERGAEVNPDLSYGLQPLFCALFPTSANYSIESSNSKGSRKLIGTTNSLYLEFRKVSRVSRLFVSGLLPESPGACNMPRPSAVPVAWCRA